MLRSRRRKCLDIEESKDLSFHFLPTIGDTLKCVTFIGTENKLFGRPLCNPARAVAVKVKNIWEQVNIPTVSIKRITDLINNHIKERNILLKSLKRDEHLISFKKKY